MADGSTIGLNAVPLIAVPSKTATVADPALDIVLAFIRAMFNAYAAAAWRSVAPPTEPIVKRAFTHDPEEYDFNEDDLPALYLFRTGSSKNNEDIAEDIRVSCDSVRLFWVMPPAEQTKQAKRVPILQALGKLVDLKIDRVRDPAFVLASDPDPTKTAEGTVVIRAAGLHWLRCLKWQKTMLALKMGAGQERKAYNALECMLEFEEEITQRYDDLAGPSQFGLMVEIADGATTPLPYSSFLDVGAFSTDFDLAFAGSVVSGSFSPALSSAFS